MAEEFLNNEDTGPIEESIFPSATPPRFNTFSPIKAKMIQGIPECINVHMEPVLLPSTAKWHVNDFGMVVGVKVDSRSTIAYSPITLPKLRKIKGIKVSVDFTTEHVEDLDTVVVFNLLFLSTEYSAYKMQSPKMSCIGKARHDFELDVKQLDSIFTVALEVDPGPFEESKDSLIGGKPVLLRAAHLEVYS